MTSVCYYFPFSSGLILSLRLILTTEIVGSKQITKAYSVLSFICGISYFSTPPLFGKYSDAIIEFIFGNVTSNRTEGTKYVPSIMIMSSDLCE